MATCLGSISPDDENNPSWLLASSYCLQVRDAGPMYGLAMAGSGLIVIGTVRLCLYVSVCMSLVSRLCLSLVSCLCVSVSRVVSLSVSRVVSLCVCLSCRVSVCLSCRVSVCLSLMSCLCVSVSRVVMHILDDLHASFQTLCSIQPQGNGQINFSGYWYIPTQGKTNCRIMVIIASSCKCSNC